MRLHVSGDAARSANAQRARAYTVDQHLHCWGIRQPAGMGQGFGPVPAVQHR
ncbi:hypothetical protein AB0G20_21665 [Streptomyces sp. NPDC024017]|uniref:hypothetical protein n=1 Tax=Streptomyces sp. NPDC024017 TaxID=3154326 RepID=UPI0033E2C796